jgi:hypothetical protein
MIVCHSHRFIFFKSKKTGGTSVELALSPLCGPNDIITPVREEDLRTSRGPQNYVVPYRDWRWRLGLRSDNDHSRQFTFFAHATAREVRRHLGADILRRYTKVTILRNPWDREVSRFYWTQDRPGIPSDFEEYVSRVTKRHPIRLPTLMFGRNIADVMLRYEHLASDFADFLRGLGVSEHLELPYAKGQTRPSGALNYRQLYSDRTRKAVGSIYRQEIEEFAYKF